MNKVALFALVVATLALSSRLHGDDAFQVSGFADVRGTTKAANPLEADAAAAQIQAGVDWSPSPIFLAHLHLLARTDDGHSENGHAGTPEAYVEARFPIGESRLKVQAGAFFLPTSRENVDALWENPYAVSSSALNSWFGEEFRPIGLDVSWTRWGATIGGTLFRGNDTLGALPLDPGWSLHDRWILLGQKVQSRGGLHLRFGGERSSARVVGARGMELEPAVGAVHPHRQPLRRLAPRRPLRLEHALRRGGLRLEPRRLDGRRGGGLGPDQALLPAAEASRRTCAPATFSSHGDSGGDEGPPASTRSATGHATSTR